MDLSEISFKVNTDALTAAANKAEALGVAVEDLAKSFTKLSKDSATANRDAARTQVILAKGVAEAEVILAKAETERSKASLNAAKEALAKAKAEGAGEEATRSATKAVQEHISMLEREESILQFMTEGYSRGQAAKLAYAKASGVANDEIKQIGDTLQQQRTLMGGDPFDKSLGSLKSLQNELEVTRRVQGMFTEGLALTQKQMEGLALDQIRLAEANKIAGRATSEGMHELKSAYLQTANAVNTLDQADKNILKSQRDAVSANAAIEKELNRVKYALQETNSELNKGASNALFRFEQNLKKSGKTLAEQKVLMDDYRKSLLSLEKSSAGRQTDYITRAVGPQITDIMVGLVTGQAPLTVMLQQGGQLRDQFALAGVEAGKMGDVMRTAAAGMVVSVKDTAKAIGGMLVGAFIDSGKAVVRITADLTGFSTASELAKRTIASQGEAWFKYIGVVNKVESALIKGLGFAVSSSVIILAALGIELFNIMKAETELSKALALTGASLGLSQKEAIAYSESLNSIGVNSLKAMSVLTEIAKAGVISSDSIALITKAAVDMEKYTGQAVEKTVEQFTKLQDKPAKALIDIAAKTGFVTAAVLDKVRALEDEGDASAATELAVIALASAYEQQAILAKSNLSLVERIWMDIKSAVAAAKESVYDFAKSEGVVNGFKTAWETVAVIVSEVWYVLKATGKEIGGIAAQISAVMRGDFAGAKAIGDSMKADAQSARKAQDDLVNSILNRNKVSDEGAKASAAERQKQQAYAKWSQDNAKALEKSYSKEIQYQNKLNQLKKDQKDLGLTDEQFKQASEGWKRVILGDNKPRIDNSGIIEANKEINAYNKAAEFYNDLMGISEGKTKSYNNELEYLNNLRNDYVKTAGKFGISQESYNDALDKLNKKQPGYIKQLKEQAEAEKEVADGHRLIAALLGKADDKGAEYYSNQDRLFKLLNKGFDSTLILQALAALEQTTPAFRKNEAAVNDLNKQFAESNKQLLDQDEALKNEAANLWDTNDVRERKNALLKVEIQYQKELASVLDAIATKGLTDPAEIEKALNNAVSNKNFGLKLINDTATVESMKKAKEEFDKFSSEISGIVTDALFHGGKDGAVRIRKAIVAQLLKPVELVVNAVVNTLLGSALGSLSTGGGVSQAMNGINTIGAAGTLGKSALGYFGLSGATTAGIAANTSIGMAAGLTAAEASAAASAAGAAAAGSTIGKAISMAFDPVTLGIGLLIGALASLDDSGTFHTGGAGAYSTKTGSVYGASVEKQLDFNLEGYTTQATMDASVSISKSIATMLDQTANTFGQQAGYYAATAFADDSSKDGAWGALMVKLGDQILLDWGKGVDNWPGKEFANGEQGVKEYATALAADVRTVLDNMGLPSWAKKLMQDLGSSPTVDQLSQVVNTINQIQFAIKYLGDTLGYTVSDITELVNIFGDASIAMQNMTKFYENFYPEQERVSILTRQMTTSFSNLGKELPKSREAFRAMVDAAFAAGDTKLVANLLLLQDGIISLNPVVETVVASIDNLKSAYENLSSFYTKSITDLKSVGNTLTDYLKSLKLGSLSNATPLDKYASAKATYEQTVAGSKTAPTDEAKLEAMRKLPEVSTAFLEASRLVYGSSAGYNQDLSAVEQAVGSAITNTQYQTLVAENSLAELKKAVTGISGVNDAVLGVKETFDKALLEYVASNGANNSSDATVSAVVNTAYQTLFGRNADTGGLDWWTKALTTGAVDEKSLYSSLLSSASPNDLSANAALSLGTGSYQSSNGMQVLFNTLVDKIASLEATIAETAIANIAATDNNTDVIARVITSTAATSSYTESLVERTTIK